ncbi:MAG: tRNA uridine-5-carboxymethylaminomethyl(34) synthesis GTPase MnmE [Deltaproteobacteria bacterium]|jgi:tRNA modification GTPase|nr:tRNA uridine-5-carboxymethylaminomethyl(34) synthesis GTPase MnmE [Deltaproteobacteria bacterium]
MITDSDTIAAIATPPGRGGIGIVKMSGKDAFTIARDVFRPSKKRADDAQEQSRHDSGGGDFTFETHRLYHGYVIDPKDNTLLDEVLISAMRAPNTYTREDVVEINTHGGAVAMHAILELALSKGARLAEPGEFTRRAFLNGRIDLTQAEAVIDVINARTQKNLELAAAQISGKLKDRVAQSRSSLVGILTQVEAAIDFPEDVEDLIDPEDTITTLHKEVVFPLQGLIRNYIDAHVFRDGISVAVVGRPNVGKSSLLNQLVKKDRAIVTDFPGTTRDIIEETLNLQGIPVVISDTAGLHPTENPIEKIGIEKTLAHVNGSDLVLFMVEAHRPLGPDDHLIYEKINSKSIIMVLNKMDLMSTGSTPTLPDDWRFEDQVHISALYDRGIDQLKEKIVKLAGGETPLDLNAAIVPNLRHKLLLETSLAAVEAVIGQLQNRTSSELWAIHLQEAIDALGVISGDTVKVDVLDQIFSRFCVGK